MIFETILDMTEKFKNVQTINALFQQCVHTLKSRFTQIQTWKNIKKILLKKNDDENLGNL